MLSDVKIIIPTHKRQHYLNRVAWYYSHFDMDVYICDSTPGQPGKIINYPNIHYIWCPEKNFFTKILHVFEITDAAYYATSPDDDFLKYETLMECYDAMRADRNYSMAVGKQCFFREGMSKNDFAYRFQGNRLQELNFCGNSIIKTIKFWCNYQNILWTLYSRDTLFYGIKKLIEQKYNSQNFIEMTLGMSALIHGNIYVSKHFLNYREYVDGEHWGKEESVISIYNYFNDSMMKTDIKKFWNQKEYRKINRLGLLSYLISTFSYIEVGRFLFEKYLCKRNMGLIKILDDSMCNKIVKALSYVQY